MNFINEFIKNIVIGVILINIISAFVISKEYEKYINFFSGLLLIIIILSMGEKMVAKLTGFDLLNNNVLSSNYSKEKLYKNNNINVEEVSKTIARIREDACEKYEEYIKDELSNKYEMNVKKIILRYDKENDNKIKEIIVKIDKKYEANNYKDNESNITRIKEKNIEEITDKIYMEIKKIYNIRRENVRVKFV